MKEINLYLQVSNQEPQVLHAAPVSFPVTELKNLWVDIVQVPDIPTLLAVHNLMALQKATLVPLHRHVVGVHRTGEGPRCRTPFPRTNLVTW